MASKVHKVRFYNPEPQCIKCLSFNKFQKHIALARNDASIEIWDLNSAPYLLRFIPGVENGSVEALGWVHNRLLSTGVHGALIEWDTVKLCQRTALLVTGGAAWCLDINSANTLVAVGTDQGYINVYSVENDDIMYNKLFDKQEGRIMCCRFNKTANLLVTGSVDTIRVWNVDTGHAMTRISVTRRKKETVVWCLAIITDSVIVSGDSLGRLTFWDGTLGEQIESHAAHKADILTIAVSENEETIYCSGTDPTISQFIKAKGHGKNTSHQWVKHVQLHNHEHDVKALAVCGDKLVSVGVDGYLTFSSYPPKRVMRVPPMIPMRRSAVCSRKKLLLLRYSNYLEVWKLGSNKTNDRGNLKFKSINTSDDNEADSNKKGSTLNGWENQILKITENPVKLVAIQTKHNKQIQCCELSPSGEFIVYTTDSDIRILRLDIDETEVDQSDTSLSKVLINGISSACDRVAFTEDSRTMVAHCGNVLQVLEVDPEAGASVVQTIAIHNILKTTAILHLLVSKKTPSGGTYIIVADACGIVEVLIERKKKFVHYITLPKHHSIPTALTVDTEQEALIIVYADQKVMEYNLAKKKFTGWPGNLLPAHWYSRQTAVVSVSVHPRRNALVFHDETALWILERSTQIQDDEPEVKRRPEARKRLGLTVIPVKYLAGFHWIGEDEAVMLEVLPKNIVAQLPPPVRLNNWHIRP